MDLILASTSVHRRRLLERLRIPFSSSGPNVDESVNPGETPEGLAKRLALAKAAALHRPGTVCVGSDQVAALGDQTLGKPGGRDSAIRQLHLCQGKEVVFFTAVAVSVDAGQTVYEHVDRTIVKFRQLTDTQLERYVDQEQPFDCAGSFKAEGLGILLFDSIRTNDPTALIGLPLIWLSGQLMELGLSPL